MKNKKSYEIKTLIDFIENNPELIYEIELSDFEFEELTYEECSEIIEIYA